MEKLFLSSLFSLLLFVHSVSAYTTYNVISFGANPDGRTDSTQPFRNAWSSACASTSPAIIYVPSGRYLLGHIVFHGGCRNSDVRIIIQGTLVAPYNYREFSNISNWLAFQNVNGVSIYGGTLDGQGSSLWYCKSTGNSCPTGARSLVFRDSRNILINGVTSISSQKFHFVLDNAQNVTMQGVVISAPGNSPNTDGIHVEKSTNVRIVNSGIRTGDDCISVGPGTRNLWIENIACGPGHGISIGSLGWSLNESGVKNVTVKNVTMTGTTNGLRIKSWARPSNGFARGIVFENVRMENVRNPIIIDQNYCSSSATSCPHKASSITVSQVTYRGIRGTSATPTAVKINCSVAKPCTGIRLEDITLTYQNQIAKSFCAHAHGIAAGLIKPSSCLN
uniref:Polygalacturonase-like n=1 Tax=Nelumbo nucifera TaxID=4432 RepID=A0A822ZJ02_NELNU|nr:TPA_asm: hypothetical protein HUJ06_001589 [Nelumbo nucifera]